jgi:hypothetical protein
MMWRRHHLIWVILLAIQPLMLSGCGSNAPPPGATGTPSAQDALSDMVSLLNHFKSEGKPPPATIAQIMPIEPGFPNAYLGLVRKEIDYVWGQSIDPAGAGKVLAYEKAVETGSGYVLMQDGTIKTMQSAEFQALPKAGK